MSEPPAWQYDEMRHIGKDFSDLAEVEAYDARNQRFRNVEQENDRILAILGVRPEDVIIELGTGTGRFALQAAPRCAKVFAVDISRTMLAYAQTRAEAAGIANITFCHGGFLTYSHDAPPADAIVTSIAFHHLPDFWKGIALRRMSEMLKPGGQLFMSDVIFTPENLEANIESWLVKLEAAAGPDVRTDAVRHIKNEHSTYDWIMDGLLERAGFEIKTKEIQDGVIIKYLCHRTY